MNSFFSRLFHSLAGLLALCLSEEAGGEGQGGEGSMGKSLWAAGVDSRLRSLVAMLPGRLAVRSISSALMRRLKLL